jgi:hypothetical protein
MSRGCSGVVGGLERLPSCLFNLSGAIQPQAEGALASLESEEAKANGDHLYDSWYVGRTMVLGEL